ncbi:MAG: orotate phosphoribosyltransferase [Acidobacteriaceae bacterium]|nr:orotate phosphoribosyltransferase [Acidobacteriaceae bacterium]MBV9781874.1 orotate phosphoribosyltransferase [Acidobacteriaceae bacterium]
MSVASEREQLKRLLVGRSIRRGEFRLASGSTSNVYVDGKLTTLHAPAMPLVGRLFLDKIWQRGWKPKAIGGLVLGADPIVSAVARESLEAGSSIDAFLVRKEAKKHGTQKFIEGMDETAGAPVVIVDDVCTTGGSTVEAIDKARNAGMTVLGAICLVDREEGAAENLARAGCAFDRVFRLTELLEAHASAELVGAQASRI